MNIYLHNFFLCLIAVFLKKNFLKNRDNSPIAFAFLLFETNSLISFLPQKNEQICSIFDALLKTTNTKTLVRFETKNSFKKDIFPYLIPFKKTNLTDLNPFSNHKSIYIPSIIKDSDVINLNPFSNHKSIYIPSITKNKVITSYYPKKVSKVTKTIIVKKNINGFKISFTNFYFLLLFLFLSIVSLYLLLNYTFLKGHFSKLTLKGHFSKLTQLVKNNIVELFSYNEFIYLDKVKNHEKDNQFFFIVKHFYLDVKEGEYLILTQDFNEYGLSVGMKGIITKIIGHKKIKKIEVCFFFNQPISSTWTPNQLQKMIPCLIKEKSKS